MAAEHDAPPAGRYGRSADERADRKLKIAAWVLGAALVGFVGWAGVHYVTKSDVTGQLLRSQTVSDTSVQAVVEVRKDADAVGVCTLYSLGADGREVGRRDVTFDRRAENYTERITMRTTEHAAATQLEGCRTASGHTR
ncbi:MULTISPECIES: DUF4307 domain-containing protein [Streptomyces]|uniref:DUF4307 domain-containing protein n=1 Tax=Streptomyces luteosporeus TaxID=173856 RepID=A0ABN3U835_9ACTN